MDMEKQMNSNDVDEVELADIEKDLEVEGERWGEIKYQSQVSDFCNY